MYIWTGIDVSAPFAAIGSRMAALERDLHFAYRNSDFPLHISLKISFFLPDEKAEEAIADIAAIYRQYGAFSIEVAGIVNEGPILWLRMAENKTLNAIHDSLNALLSEKYSVPMHPYDGDYKFHTTLFMDEDREKVAAAAAALGDFPHPREISASTFCIGCSDTGAPSTYRIVKTLQCSEKGSV